MSPITCAQKMNYRASSRCICAAEYFDTAQNETIIVNWVGEPKAGGTELTVFKMGSDFKRKVVGSTKIDFTQYSIHHLSMAGGYAFMVLAPVEIKFLKTGVTTCLSCSAKDNLDSGTPTKVLVYSLVQGDENPVNVIDIDETDAFFVFHHINAVLTGDDEVTLDVCAYSNMDGIIGEHVLGNLEDLNDQATRNSMTTNCDILRRITIDLSVMKVKSISDVPVSDNNGNSYRIELPTVSPNYVSKSYCYVYANTNHMNGSPLYEDIGVLQFRVLFAQMPPLHFPHM